MKRGENENDEDMQRSLERSGWRSFVALIPKDGADSFEQPWRRAVFPSGHEAEGLVVDIRFPSGEVKPMIISTGSDISVAPWSIGERSGLRWEDGKAVETDPIGGAEHRYWSYAPTGGGRVLPTRIVVEPTPSETRPRPVKWELEVPILYVKDDSTPFVLGRQGFLDLMDFEANGKRRTFRLTLHPKRPSPAPAAR